MKDQERVVGVVGAGIMGAGLCEDLLQQGYGPVLVDIESSALDAAATRIRRSLGARAMFTKSKRAETVDATMARLGLSTDYQTLADADFVIENVNENIDLKREVFEALEKVVAPSCILIANTSCIPITRLGSFIGLPGRLIGVHFMNPVPLKDTVEVIPGEMTSPDTLRETGRFLDEVGKKYVVVRDSPGFVSNRVLMPTINEAIFLIHEGVAVAEDVDAIFKSCFDHKMGPLETADLIGLDTILDSLRVLEACLGGSKFRPCPLLEKMVEEGNLGRKSGRGFFAY
ncbi:MAG: 3-hydroxyacyl-CoA dehydrogenase family protein [Alphaproteobacteria bacterium]|nr:3-hydroxyacyl-CoA dehydrogenase family protein [Alphaproteobacteria bacterium]